MESLEARRDWEARRKAFTKEYKKSKRRANYVERRKATFAERAAQAAADDDLQDDMAAEALAAFIQESGPPPKVVPFVHVWRQIAA